MTDGCREIIGEKAFTKITISMIGLNSISNQRIITSVGNTNSYDGFAKIPLRPRSTGSALTPRCLELIQAPKTELRPLNVRELNLYQHANSLTSRDARCSLIPIGFLHAHLEA